MVIEVFLHVGARSSGGPPETDAGRVGRCVWCGGAIMIQRALNDTDWTFLSGDEQTRAGAPPRPQDLADAGSMASVASGGVLSVAAGAEMAGGRRAADQPASWRRIGLWRNCDIEHLRHGAGVSYNGGGCVSLGRLRRGALDERCLELPPRQLSTTLARDGIWNPDDDGDE